MKPEVDFADWLSDMPKIGVIDYIDRSSFILKSAGIFGELNFNVNGKDAFLEAAELIGKAEYVLPACSELIECARLILEVGLTDENRKRLSEILGSIS